MYKPIDRPDKRKKRAHEYNGGDVSNLLYQYCKDNNLTLIQLAKKLEMYEDGIWSIIHRDRTFGILFVLAIHKRLGIDGNELLEACRKTHKKHYEQS